MVFTQINTFSLVTIPVTILNFMVLDSMYICNQMKKLHIRPCNSAKIHDIILYRILLEFLITVIQLRYICALLFPNL